MIKQPAFWESDEVTGLSLDPFASHSLISSWGCPLDTHLLLLTRPSLDHCGDRIRQLVPSVIRGGQRPAKALFDDELCICLLLPRCHAK